MAMSATVRVVHDGTRNVIFELTGLSDGEGPAETLVRKVRCRDLQPPCQSVKVTHIDYAVSYGVVSLLWDAMQPKEFVVLEGSNEFDFTKNGGITNDLVSAGDDSATGDILLTATGFDAGSSYSLRLNMVKKFAT